MKKIVLALVVLAFVGLVGCGIGLGVEYGI